MNEVTAINRPRAGRPTREQAEARHEELLDRALDHFLDKGFEQATIEAIAADVVNAGRRLDLPPRGVHARAGRRPRDVPRHGRDRSGADVDLRAGAVEPGEPAGRRRGDSTDRARERRNRAHLQVEQRERVHPGPARALRDGRALRGLRLVLPGRRRAHATYFESHGTDEHSALIWGMDLTPLLGGAEPAELVRNYIARFEAEVAGRVARLSPKG